MKRLIAVLQDCGDLCAYTATTLRGQNTADGARLILSIAWKAALLAGVGGLVYLIFTTGNGRYSR